MRVNGREIAAIAKFAPVIKLTMDGEEWECGWSKGKSWRTSDSSIYFIQMGFGIAKRHLNSFRPLAALAKNFANLLIFRINDNEWCGSSRPRQCWMMGVILKMMIL